MLDYIVIFLGFGPAILAVEVPLRDPVKEGFGAM